jgi:hypothetical protein
MTAVLYVYVVYEGTVTISSQQMSKNIANLTKEDVIISQDHTKVKQVVARPATMWMGGGIGGSVWGDIWKGVRSAASNVWNEGARPAINRLFNKVGRGFGYSRYGGGMMSGEEADDSEQPHKRSRQDEKYSDQAMDSGMEDSSGGQLEQDPDGEEENVGGGQLISRAQLQRNLRQDDGNC